MPTVNLRPLSESQIIAQYRRMCDASAKRFEKHRDASQPVFDRAESTFRAEIDAADAWLDAQLARL